MFSRNSFLFFIACSYWETTLFSKSTAQRVTHPSTDWSGWGGDFYNNRWASENRDLFASKANSLVQKCRLNYTQGVSATPTINGHIVYFPTWNGSLVALNYLNCRVQFDISIADIITNFAPLTPLQQQSGLYLGTRTSPQVHGDIVYVGTQAHALVLALDRFSGTLLAITQIHQHPLAIVTQSPTIYKGRLFVGTASVEETAQAVVPDYNLTFVGTMVALSVKPINRTLRILWNVPMLPLNQGWAGAAVWGSQPSIDAVQSQVFIATGNTYTVPTAYASCLNDVTASASCIPPGVYQEAVLAIDIQSGRINWARILNPLEAWTAACGSASGIAVSPRNITKCPESPGPDADFGMAPTFVPGSPSTPHKQDVLVIGQKNGVIHALSAQTGATFWSRAASPGGIIGGLIWGIAVDCDQIYFTGVNGGSQLWSPGIYANSPKTSYSGFGSLRLVDGQALWGVPSPFNSTSLTPPSVVNDVAFFGFVSSRLPGSGTGGGLIAIHKTTGKIIKNFALDDPFYGGIAIQNSMIMFGTGYRKSFYPGNGSFLVWSI